MRVEIDCDFTPTPVKETTEEDFVVFTEDAANEVKKLLVDQDDAVGLSICSRWRMFRNDVRI